MTEENLRKKLYDTHTTLQQRVGLMGVHVQDLFKTIGELLNSIPTSLYQEYIEESDEFKRLKTNLSESLEKYRLEVHKLFDNKAREHKKNADKYER